MRSRAPLVSGMYHRVAKHLLRKRLHVTGTYCFSLPSVQFSSGHAHCQRQCLLDHISDYSHMSHGNSALPVLTSSINQPHSVACGHYSCIRNVRSVHAPNIQRQIPLRWFSTESSQTDHSESSSKEGSTSEFKLVYTAPLKGAIRAIKVFSLSTATAAVIGGPILVWLGNPSVPLSGRIIMSSLVMLVGISTTALLHWLVKGYVIRMYFNEETKMVQLYTLSVFGRKKLHEFNISDAKPPSATAFSSFQAKGKSYFVHAEVIKDKKMLSGLLGVYADIETSDM